jgi:methylglutaconyl-CoA hydratase
MTEHLLVERRDGLVLVRLNRPERSNALSRQLIAELGELGRQLRAERELKLVLLTGSGLKAFCAGADLKERLGMTTAAVREQLQAYRTELGWLADLDVPTVAALNGAALGGGLELAMLCDLRVAASHVVLGLPETSLAIIPGAGGTQRLPRLIGPSRALEMVLLGRRLTADEALQWGLINRICPAGEDLIVNTLDWLAPILHGAPVAQRAALEAVRCSTTHSLQDGLSQELALYERCLTSADRVEALCALQERRPPRFTGC